MDARNPKKSGAKGRTLRSAAPSSGQATQKEILVNCPSCRTENLSDSRFCSHCATPLRDQASSSGTIKSPTFEIERGDLFAGRYEVIETLGHGGMGKVYKAYDRKINEVVALKLIRPEISINDKAIERFKNELKIARKITHRNICRMHDLGEEGFYHYITMEYVAGEDLKRFIRRAGTLSSGKALNVAKQVCEGLAEAHRLGVIHRDLKPQNIMIDQDGNAKIMDFGIARFVDTDRMTGSGVMIGTPEYMSPEQAELKDVDKRADIYSLGVVLYEMVSGQVPFEGETPLSIAMKHKTEQPRNVRELNAHVSAALAGIISKCMQKNPGSRYQSAEALLEELIKAEQDLSTAERIVPKKDFSRAKDKTAAFSMKKILAPAAGLLLIGVAVFGILKWLPKKETRSEPVQTANVSPQPKASDQEASVSSRAEERKQGVQKNEAAAKQGTAPIPAVKKKDESKINDTAQTGSLDAEIRSANLAAARAMSARGLAQKEGVDVKSAFFRLAEDKLQEGQKYISQNNAGDARWILIVSEKLFRICQKKSKDEDRLKAFKGYVEDLRKEIEDKRNPGEKDKSYESAREAERQAAALQGKKDIENAAKSFIQASITYERILQSLKPGKK